MKIPAPLTNQAVKPPVKQHQQQQAAPQAGITHQPQPQKQPQQQQPLKQQVQPQHQHQHQRIPAPSQPVGTRYFVIKCANEDNFTLSKRVGAWATQAHNEQTFADAYQKGIRVILIMSVNKTGHFQGYARMTSLPGEAPRVHWAGIAAAVNNFRVDWECLNPLPFEEVQYMRNPWNENKPVKICRDGTELPPDLGEKLVSMMQARPPGRGRVGGGPQLHALGATAAGPGPGPGHPGRRPPVGPPGGAGMAGGRGAGHSMGVGGGGMMRGMHNPHLAGNMSMGMRHGAIGPGGGGMGPGGGGMGVRPGLVKHQPPPPPRHAGMMGDMDHVGHQMSHQGGGFGPGLMGMQGGGMQQQLGGGGMQGGGMHMMSHQQPNGLHDRLYGAPMGNAGFDAPHQQLNRGRSHSPYAADVSPGHGGRAGRSRSRSPVRSRQDVSEMSYQDYLATYEKVQKRLLDMKQLARGAGATTSTDRRIVDDRAAAAGSQNFGGVAGNVSSAPGAGMFNMFGMFQGNGGNGAANSAANSGMGPNMMTAGPGNMMNASGNMMNASGNMPFGGMNAGPSGGSMMGGAGMGNMLSEAE